MDKVRNAFSGTGRQHDLRTMASPDHNPIPSSTLTIRFQDCDPFNHLNYGCYVDYSSMRAREAADWRGRIAC